MAHSRASERQEQVTPTLLLSGLGPRRPWLVVVAQVLILMWGLAAGGALAAGAHFYRKYSKGLPSIPTVRAYHPPLLSELRSHDGRLLAEFFDERRKLISYERIPRRLIQAFVASEDKNFFDHHGFDALATARAAFQDAIGYHIRGASTITQQTAKAIMISAVGEQEATARKLSRKIKELILARRLEASLDKEEILYLYLNHVYLGHHAYGVRAAAENYFHKQPGELSLAEMALIAGLPQAPSRYSPFAHPESARKRRAYVLKRMQEEEMISDAERSQAAEAPIQVYPMDDLFRDRAPFFAEQIRREVVARYGNERLLRDGLRIESTLDVDRNHEAQVAMLRGLTRVDRRQGYFGPLMHLEPEAVGPFLDRIARAMAGRELEDGQFYVGRVAGVSKDGASAEIQVGNRSARLSIATSRWARKPNPEAYYPSALIDRLDRVLQKNDVVLVRSARFVDLEQVEPSARRLLPKGELVTLEQLPHLQGALISLDPHNGYVASLIGGYDFDASEFNRATQACRQPGSAFKPIVYSKAIDKLNWTMSTVLVDSPIVYDDTLNAKTWKPENYESDFQGDVPLRVALVNSMNIPAIKTLAAVGPSDVAAWARHLGITSPISEDLSIALGSSCVTLWDLTQVYTLFDRLGTRVRPVMIRRVLDRSGRVLEDHVTYDDVWAPLSERLAGGYAAALTSPERLIEPTTAYLTNHLLQEVVQMGTGAEASKLGKPAGGKTGTTNDSFDAWFMGFTQDLVTGVWVGYDTMAMPLGRYENGGRAALPIWLDYMQEALKGRPQRGWDPVGDIVWALVDRHTGRPVSPGSPQAIREPFKRGTEPASQNPLHPVSSSALFTMPN
jgi:penicillin-binding protein 1A